MTIKERMELPPAFADLEQFSAWCLDTNSLRYNKRISSSMAEVQEFYNAMLPRVEEALAWLDRMPLDELPQADLQLLKLCLSLSEAALSVEVYKAPALKLAPPPSQFVISSSGMTVG